MSPRQRQVLGIVHDAIAAAGVSPSLTEIAERTGATRAAACLMVQSLEAAGYLRRVGGPYANRSLEVLQLPGGGLSSAELAWCRANPARVRAMRALAGAIRAEDEPVEVEP